LQLSLFEHFVEDENEAVRQSACLCLPALSKRIENLEHRRSYTVRAFEALLDSGDLVEYTLLEIIGEIIHIFQDDLEGPPLELLEVFYSQAPVNQASSEDELIREFDNLDRAIVSAFNVSTTFVRLQGTWRLIPDIPYPQLPAVCLALGPERWAELRPTYKALCNINHQRIIASLAAAVHELAKILGPEISAYDLLPSFTEYIHGADEAKVKVLGGLPSFVSSLPVDEALAVIEELSAMWIGGSLPNWRHREALASHFAALLKHMASVGEASTAFGLLNHGLADTFQAIREATIANVGSLFGVGLTDRLCAKSIIRIDALVL
jgi:serine/threonine-protein phosphatase 4 regulatory subunit 1